MIERLYPLHSRIETGSRVIKKRPIELLDIDRQSGEKAIRISMDGNNTAIVVEELSAVFMGIAILEKLSDDTLKHKYIEGDTKSQLITRLKNILGRFEQS